MTWKKNNDGELDGSQELGTGGRVFCQIKAIPVVPSDGSLMILMSKVYSLSLAPRIIEQLHNKHCHAEHSQPALLVVSAVNELTPEIKLPSSFPRADLLNPNEKMMGCVITLVLLSLTLYPSGSDTDVKQIFDPR